MEVLKKANRLLMYKRMTAIVVAFVLAVTSAPFTSVPMALSAEESAPTDTMLFLAEEVSTDIINEAVYARSTYTSLSAVDFKLNMTAETLDIGDYPIVGMSIDGGGKWSKSGFDKVLKKLFNKGGTLWITDELDSKGKTAASSANVVKWGAIQARPKANPAKAKVSYGKIYPSSHSSYDIWFLSTNYSSTSVVGGYEFTRIEGTNAKAPTSDAVWYPYPETDTDTVWTPILTGSDYYYYNEYYIQIPYSSATGKTIKETYFFRVPATSKSAGSKTWKVTVSSLLPALKYKIDYKTETIKLKAGDSFWTSFTSTYDFYVDENMNYSISHLIDEPSYSPIAVWKESTGKKPPSTRQYIPLLPRADMPPAGDMIISQGSLDKTQIKPYEFSTNGGKTWGKLPKINRNYTGSELMVRVKYDKKVGLAASKPVNLEITYGKLNEKDSYMGITAATVVHLAEPSP